MDDRRFIRFDYERGEFDLETMVQQGRLDAGPLMGLLEIRGLSQEEQTSLQQGKHNDARYVALEKRVVKLFYPPVKGFLGVLRARYGQYWVPEIEMWDSRQESASSYLNRFGYPQWSLDGGKTWGVFRSGTIGLSLGALRKQQDFREYLTEEDWREIASLVQQGWEPSLAASVMIEAVELFDRGHIRHAIIDAVTALEMAVGESFRQRLASDSQSAFAIEELPFHVQVGIVMTMGDGAEGEPPVERIQKIRSKYLGLKLSKQFQIMANVLKIPDKDTESALEVMKIRNDLVHEGKAPPDNVTPQFSGLLRAFASLLPDQKLRFPLAHPGNRRMTSEE